MIDLKIEGLTITDPYASTLTEAAGRSGASLPAFVGGGPRNYFVEFDIGGHRMKFPVTSVIIERRLDEFPDKSILEVCRGYVAWLEALVSECKGRFPSE